MKYNFMDSELMEIGAIKDLEFVKFYDLTTNQDKKKIIVPALMINYNNGKMLNLSILDKYFNQFVQKVISVYKKEKGRMVENDETDPFEMFHEIAIDKRSIDIIENSSILEKKEITGFYDDKDSYDNSLLFQIDEVRSIIDIVRFSIQYFSRSTDLNINILDSFYGCRDNYIIESKINDIFTYLLIHYERLGDNSYQISVGNLGGLAKPYIININFFDNMIIITSKYKKLTIHNEFKIDDSGGKYLYYAYLDGKSILYEAGELDQVEINHEKIANLDYDSKLTWYKLPWVAYFGYQGERKNVDDHTSILTSHIMYLDINNDNFNKREHYLKKLEREKTDSQKAIKLTLDELRKNTFGFLSDDAFVIETSFHNALGDGDYQKNYNGKYFYHIAPKEAIKEIDRKKLIPVRKSIIFGKNDLLNSEKVKKLGGE